MTTATINPTLQTELDKASPTEIADILRLMGLGTMLAPLKRAFTSLTGAATYDLTALDASGEVVGAANPNRLPLLALRTLRIVTATTATVEGTYVLTDASGTAVTAGSSGVVGIAKISDDGKTLTFPSADVTAFTIEYIPRSKTDMTTLPTGSGIGTTP
jgi:hypothetical protein